MRRVHQPEVHPREGDVHIVVVVRRRCASLRNTLVNNVHNLLTSRRTEVPLRH